jgi:ABC-type transport system involved in multi-copper enzyme maturation permease subunit
MVLCFYTFLLHFLFIAIGIFISVIIKKARPITTISTGLVLFLYFLFTISKITERFSGLGYISPFKFVRTDVMTENYSLDGWRVIYFFGIALLLFFLAYKYYQRKDIYT